MYYSVSLRDGGLLNGKSFFFLHKLHHYIITTRRFIFNLV